MSNEDLTLSSIPTHHMMHLSQLVNQGAEAKVFKTSLRSRSSHDTWGPLEADIKAGCPSTPVMDDVLLKLRFSKKYRHPTLDKSLTRQRLTGEARALMRCMRSGVNVPGIRMVDASDGILALEWIDGPPVRYLIPGGPEGPEDDSFVDEGREDERSLENESTPDNITTRAAQWGIEGLDIETLLEKIGVEIAKMHLIDIVHGDLTTSNMLVRKSNNDLVLIDFGLAYHSTLVEDKAVDLYVLERAFSSTHPDSEPLFSSVLEAYARRMGKDWDQIKRRLDDVRLRGRKRSMVG